MMTMSGSTFSRFFRNPDTGEVAVAQPPNLAIVLWLAARGTALVWDERQQQLRWIGSGALLVWATDELIRGSSPFRRILGGAVLSFQLVVLIR